uniref:Uncharacterized protein n=1 Tax=Panagrolaimus sp. ES5 TaxID=591445 RepID=A0AC34G674_9BILA
MLDSAINAANLTPTETAQEFHESMGSGNGVQQLNFQFNADGHSGDKMEETKTALNFRAVLPKMGSVPAESKQILQFYDVYENEEGCILHVQKFHNAANYRGGNGTMQLDTCLFDQPASVMVQPGAIQMNDPWELNSN